MPNNNINVKLGYNSYPIYIDNNLLKSAGNIINNLGKFSSFVVVCDKKVSKLHLKKLLSFLNKSLSKIVIIEIPQSEKSKSFYYLEYLLEKILSKKIDRNALIIAFGGGVVGDLVGLVSSLILRGVHFIQIPTTLLAQVDSSVGGKTGINSKYGKNLIGTFKQPLAVLSSIDLLKTLDAREINSGYAEIIKYALIKDKKFFNWLMINGKDVLKINTRKCIYAIKASCQIKAKIVSDDEKERGVRAILNLGHTFGHAIESITNYSKKINHGEAVLIGINLALRFSKYINICDNDYSNVFQQHLNSLKLKYNLKHYKIKICEKMMLEHMLFDKKVLDGEIRLILLKSLGKAAVHTIKNKEKIQMFLKSELNL